MEKCEVDFYDDVEIGNVVSVVTDHHDVVNGPSSNLYNHHDHQLVDESHFVVQLNEPDVLDAPYVNPRAHQNFTAREKWLLVELVDQCKHLLFAKANRIDSHKKDFRQRKLQVWAEITNEINAQCGQTHRTSSCIKNLWHYMSFRTKKALHDRANGVDPDTTGYIHFTPLHEKIATIMFGQQHPILQFMPPPVSQELFQHQQHPFVEYHPQEDRKFDTRELFNNMENQPKSAVEAMRRLLYTSAPVKRKLSNEHHYCYTSEYAALFTFDHDHQLHYKTMDHSRMETTYEDILHCMVERDKSYRRMLEARQAMLRVQTQVDLAKQEKEMAESELVSLETFKSRHLTGDLDPRFAGQLPTPFDPSLMYDEEEAPEDQENEL